MKKFAYLFVIAIIFTLFGCVTTSSVSTNPSEIEYKEIDGKNYFSSRDSELYSSQKGYKITDVFILGADTRNENGTTEALLKLATDKNAWGDNVRYVYATDFIKNIKETDSTWIDRLDSVRNEEKYAKLNATGKSIANGYIYHGAEEVEKNCKLFANGALESGHAYYISGFVVKYGGSMAKIEYGDGFFFSSQSNAVYVDYISQKVKGEVVEAGITDLFGKTIEIPITVVVAVGKGYSKTPVILGIIKEE